jgi:hypothetical protein
VVGALVGSLIRVRGDVLRPEKRLKRVEGIAFFCTMSLNAKGRITKTTV